MKIENMGSRENEDKREGKELEVKKELVIEELHCLFMTRLDMANEKHSVAALGSRPTPSFSAVTDMLQSFEDRDEEKLNSEFIQWLEVVDIDTAVRVVNDMSKNIFGNSIASQACGKTVVSLRGKEHSPFIPLFLRVCETVAAREFVHASCDMPVVDLVHNFILLGHKDLPDKLIQALMDHARVHKQFSLLQHLLKADSIWRELSGVAMGRSFSLQALAQALDTGSLCSEVSRRIQMYRHYQKPILNVSHSDDGAMPGAVLEACQILVTRDFHDPVQIDSKPMVDVILDFYYLGDEEPCHSLVQALLHQSRLHKQQYFLEKMLDTDVLLNYLARVAWDRDALRALSEERLKWYVGESQEIPEFNWRQPFAQLQDHPNVEAFLRSTQESFTYHGGFSKLAEARKFALKYFDGCYRNGYCAFGKEGGRGARAHSVIQKSPVGFLHSWRDGKEGTENRSSIVEGAESRKRPRVESPRNTERDRALAAAMDEGGPGMTQIICNIFNHHQGTRKPRGSWGSRSP